MALGETGEDWLGGLLATLMEVGIFGGVAEGEGARRTTPVAG